MSETQTRKPVKKKKGRAKRWIKRIIRLIIVLAIVLTAALFGLKAYIRKQAEQQGETESYSQASVRRGAMEDTVFGSGTTSARNQPNILAEADGTLTQLRVSVGDAVKAGDILAVITNEEIDDTITDLEFALWEMDDQITGTAAGSKETTIEAPAAGRVMAIYAGKGDDALAVFRREGALAIISTDGRMKAELRAQTRALGLTLGEIVTVTGPDINLPGTVVNLTQQGTIATITVNTDDVPMHETVTISRQNGEVLGETTLEINKPMAVSFYGGTIKKVRVEVGDTVKRKQVLFDLEDSPLTLKLEDLRLQRETSAKELEDAKALRENLIVLAPCDGVMATLDVSEGDAITSGALLGSILHGEDMNLTISVDELDVVNVAPGQKVSITVDALPGVELSGEVYKIAPVGTSSGGVTTYSVELTFDAAGTGVRSGMNATGEIQIAATDSTLYVPVEAIMTVNNETYVMVADGGSLIPAGMPGEALAAGVGNRSARAGGERGAQAVSMPQRTANVSADKPEAGFMQKAAASVRAWLYEGAETGAAQVTGSLVKVEVGMQNDDYAEILSGLSEGDVVLYTASGEAGQSMFRNMRGGMGGMGGMFGF